MCSSSIFLSNNKQRSSPSLTFKRKHLTGKRLGSAHSTATSTSTSLLCLSFHSTRSGKSSSIFSPQHMKVGGAAPSSHLLQGSTNEAKVCLLYCLSLIKYSPAPAFPSGVNMRYCSCPFPHPSSLRSIIYYRNRHLVSATSQQHLHWVWSGKAVTSHAFSDRQWLKSPLSLALLTGQVWELRLLSFSQLTSLSNQNLPPIYFCPLCKPQSNIFFTSPTAEVTISFPSPAQEGVGSTPASADWPPPPPRPRRRCQAQLWRRPKMAPAAPCWGGGARGPRPCSATRENQLS